MPQADIMAYIIDMATGAREIIASEIIDLVSDVGTAIVPITKGTVVAGNGVGTEVAATVTIEEGAASGTTAGLGVLAMDVGALGAAIAPALGILAGVGLYNLAPEFWTNLSNALVEAGKTVGGKVVAFFNKDGNLSVDEDTLNIYKNAFINEGLYNGNLILENFPYFTYISSEKISYDITAFFMNALDKVTALTEIGKNNYIKIFQLLFNEIRDTFSSGDFIEISVHFSTSGNLRIKRYNYKPPYIYRNQVNGGHILFADENSKLLQTKTYYDYYDTIISYDTNYIKSYLNTPNFNPLNYSSLKTNQFTSSSFGFIEFTYNVDEPLYIDNRDSTSYGQYFIFYTYNLGISEPSENIQPDATYPNATDPIPTTYPTWTPVPNLPDSWPKVFPLEIPDINPTPSQQQAQNPTPTPDPSDWLDWVTPVLPVPEPLPSPSPAPTPTPTPDPDPEPEVEPDPTPQPDPNPQPTPVDPNPTPDPGDTPILPSIPATTPSNRLFTVYNPTIEQLNQLGAFLWSDSIITQLLKIWQNPLDAVISLIKVYAPPVTASNKNIILGYIDSSVESRIVTSQFTNVDCGTVTINESKHNATDYSPYSSVHLYLPFIGIVELDADEVMNGTIRVQYVVDVYTGTCMAEVTVTRTPDLPNQACLYTFSGNASQQIPLTSSNAHGMLSALVNTAIAGMATGAGGAIATAAHSMTHELVHISHSGSLSANAGIMGIRKPYVILGRRHGYDANAYNEIYGYPANKTDYLSNMSGFVRIVGGRLTSTATEPEKEEIMRLLKEGVIL